MPEQFPPNSSSSLFLPMNPSRTLQRSRDNWPAELKQAWYHRVQGLFFNLAMKLFLNKNLHRGLTKRHKLLFWLKQKRHRFSPAWFLPTFQVSKGPFSIPVLAPPPTLLESRTQGHRKGTHLGLAGLTCLPQHNPFLFEFNLCPLPGSSPGQLCDAVYLLYVFVYLNRFKYMYNWITLL